ncbi:MAG: flagellar brake protein [Roseburia sp.]|nr:flagellar brake protein [Roseburia sp.]MCM1096990.1 flagellar brake protein [Ruminococcus flavefaciens]
MLSKFVTVGNRVELQAVERNEDVPEEGAEREIIDRGKVYRTRVHSILSEDTLEIVMPMEKSKLILLPVDAEYDFVFYTDNGLYQCFAQITDRYKSNNVYIIVAELTSNLRKHQRREYYRFSCAIEMNSRNLSNNEVKALENNSNYGLTPGLPLKQSVIVDISGGGLRFLSSQKYEPEQLLYINYHLLRGEEQKKFEVIGKVISVRELENRHGVWEHRVQYYNMDLDTREEIIQYIFEEERKSRRKGRL